MGLMLGNSYDTQNCSIARALEAVGERWSLLILRDAVRGTRRVEDFLGGLARAREKRTRKGLDVIVHNDVSVEGIGFEGDDNAVTIIGPGEDEQVVARTSKTGCAERVLDAVAPLLASRAGS